MPSAMLYRLSGIALLLGTLLILLFSSLGYLLFGANQLSYLLAANGLTMLSAGRIELVTEPLWLAVNLVIFVGSMVLLTGLPGMYVSLAKQAGWLGLLGFVLTMTAVLLVGVINQAFLLIILPIVVPYALHLRLTEQAFAPLEGFYPAARLIFGLGTFFLGFAILRVGVLPQHAKVTGIALIVAAACTVVQIVPVPDALWMLIPIGSVVGALSFLLGLAVFGYTLVSLSGVETVQPTLSSPEVGSSEATR
jgi:hypothetical protein